MQFACFFLYLDSLCLSAPFRDQTETNSTASCLHLIAASSSCPYGDLLAGKIYYWSGWVENKVKGRGLAGWRCVEQKQADRWMGGNVASRRCGSCFVSYCRAARRILCCVTCSGFHAAHRNTGQQNLERNRVNCIVQPWTVRISLVSTIERWIFQLCWHGAEFFFFSRIHQSHSCSRSYQNFVATECSLACSQEPATGPYPKLDESNLHPHILFKIRFSTMFTSMSWSP
jgi:hypothetical protein